MNMRRDQRYSWQRQTAAAILSVFVVASWPAAAQDAPEAEGPDAAEVGAPAAVISAFATCGTRYVTQRARTEPEKGFGPVDAGLRGACRRELQAYAAALVPPDASSSAVNAASRTIIAQHRRRFRTLFEFVSAAEVRRRQAEVATASAAASAAAAEPDVQADDDSPAETAVTVPTAPAAAPAAPPAPARTVSTRFIPLPPPRPRDLVPAVPAAEVPAARSDAPQQDVASASHGATATEVAVAQGEAPAARPALVPPVRAHVGLSGETAARPPAAAPVPLNAPAPAEIASSPIVGGPVAAVAAPGAASGAPIAAPSPVPAPAPVSPPAPAPAVSATLQAPVPPTADGPAQGWQRAPVSIGGTGVIDVELPPFPTAPPAIAARPPETGRDTTAAAAPPAPAGSEASAPMRVAELPASAAAATMAGNAPGPAKSAATPPGNAVAAIPSAPSAALAKPAVREPATAPTEGSDGVTRVSRRAPTTEQLRQLDAAIGQHRVCLARAVLAATGGSAGADTLGSVLKACTEQQEARVARELEADGPATPDMVQRVRQDVANVARSEANELMGLLRGSR